MMRRQCGFLTPGLLAATLLLVAPGALRAQEAGFDCRKAATAVEKRICASPRLSRLDWALSGYHAAAIDRFPRAKACLVRKQRDWLRDTRNRCKDAACLDRAYLQRLGELRLLPAGASQLRDIELPQPPALIWVFGPSRDTVAAPPRKGQAPLVARGRMVGVTADGAVELQSARGNYFVMGDLTSDGNEDSYFTAHADAGQVEVRGERERGNAAAFAQNACRFVYRLR